jgi:3-methylcrotonyl-CoA carboxylase alpha subunit
MPSSINEPHPGWEKSSTMFNKLLIANRGEIACRIMRSAKKLGIKTVAVYSDVDENALHVRQADEAVRLGPASASESYLNSEALLKAISNTNADAVHPGYGFFSENADFADAVGSAGVTFVGPPSKAIRDMGAKDNAKAIMEQADVPVVPGYYGSDQSVDVFTNEAERIGYPILLKAALGGGGKGMRVVSSQAELQDGMESATREAEGAFGDGRLLIEKYLTNTRHVEVQVFADTVGNCIHLFERDCSLQRRHQKVIEEAPAPGISDAVRSAMGDAAVRAAKAVDYVGAGTVEFLLTQDEHFYFMEMNTRLQVEHPVTELITGTDLVEWQLRVASGELLPITQSEIPLNGHAIEARLYAEDPSNGFMPAPGTISHLRWPGEIKGLRIDTGVEEGDTISPFYDPMIAKVICFGETREGAREELSKAMAGLEIIGPGYNAVFLKMLLEHPSFTEFNVDTAFIDGLPQTAFEKPSVSLDAIAAVCLMVIKEREDDVANLAAKSSDPYSPWNQSGCWRMNDFGHQELSFLTDGDTLPSIVASISRETDVVKITVNDEIIDDQNIDVAEQANVVNHDGKYTVFGLQSPVTLKLYDPIKATEDQDHGDSSFVAPMPGKIAAVSVSEGQEVSKGDVLVVVEAMKMEHAIKAPRDGVIESVFCDVGEQVNDGQELLAMAE